VATRPFPWLLAPNATVTPISGLPGSRITVDANGRVLIRLDGDLSIKSKPPKKTVSLEHTKELTNHLYTRIKANEIVDVLHASHHSMPKAKQADILNEWTQFIRATNYNGKEVDIFLKDGYVVITEAGDKTRVITSYGNEFSNNGKSVDSRRWSFSRWEDGESYYKPIKRNTQR